MQILVDIANFKIIQIIVFGSIFAGVFYFTFYDNGKALQSSISSLQTQVDQLETDIKKKQKELENIKIFEKETLAQEQFVKYFLSYIPSSLTFTDISSLLIKEAKFSGVNIEVKKDKEIQAKTDSEYQPMQIQLKITGVFVQILTFLSRLTHQKRMIIVDKISMNTSGKDRLISADLNVSAYRYKKQQKKDKSEKKEEKK